MGAAGIRYREKIYTATEAAKIEQSLLD